MPKTPHISRPPSLAAASPRRPRAPPPAATSSASSPQRSAIVAPPRAPIFSSGTSAASHAWARRASSSGAQLTTTRPQHSPKSVAAASSPRARSWPRGPLPQASAISASATARPPSETSCAELSTPLARELAEQVAQPAQRGQVDLGDAAGADAGHQRLPLRAVVGRRRRAEHEQRPARVRRAPRAPPHRPAPARRRSPRRASGGSAGRRSRCRARRCRRRPACRAPRRPRPCP